MKVDHYLVFCETSAKCRWRRNHIPTKAQAKELGKEHVDDKHPRVKEWVVRIQGIRMETIEEVIMDFLADYVGRGEGQWTQPHATQCTAHSEGQYCCLDLKHPLFNDLVTGLAATLRPEEERVRR